MIQLNSSFFNCEWDELTLSEAKKLKGPILIGGASGFIGARLFHSLISIRSDVYAISQNIHSSWRMIHLPSEIIKNNL